jgi:serine carboxypeptidase-like clade 1
MVFIESPVGVGFSYSDANDYKCNDDRSATENIAAIEKFFEMYSELKENKLFLTGESYAGVYVPTLAEAIVKATIAGTYTGAPLTGIAVGNGCSGTEVGTCAGVPQGTYYEWEYLTQTGFVDPPLKNQINSVCNWTAAAINVPDALSAACVDLLNKASAQVGHVNMYGIYSDCISDSCHPTADDTTKRGKIPSPPAYTIADEKGQKFQLQRINPYGPDQCIDSAAASGFFNRPDVQEAIHVRNPGFCWAVCNSIPGWSYQKTRPNLPRDTYPLLVSNIQVLIYNGDWDACVPYTDGYAWTEGMGFSLKSEWHNWQYTSESGFSGQVAGYAVEYDVSSLKPTVKAANGNSFSFVTIRGGRHEVPETAGAQAMEMLNRLIQNKPF